MSHDNLVYRIISRLYATLFPPHRRPFDAIESSKLFPGLYQQPTTLAYLDDDKYGDLPHGRIAFLCSLAKIGYGPILEFGTFRGRTTYNLAINSSCKIYTIDIGPSLGRAIDMKVSSKGIEYGQYVAGELFLDAPDEIRSRIELIIRDSTECDLSFLKGKCGMIFIDGGHSYDVCKKDTIKALELAKEGGVLIWDDYHTNWPGVMKFLDELSKTLRLYYLPEEHLVVHIVVPSVTEASSCRPFSPASK